MAKYPFKDLEVGQGIVVAPEAYSAAQSAAAQIKRRLGINMGSRRLPDGNYLIYRKPDASVFDIVDASAYEPAPGVIAQTTRDGKPIYRHLSKDEMQRYITEVSRCLQLGVEPPPRPLAGDNSPLAF